MILNPTIGGSAIPYKSGERAKIEQQGFDIVANVGDQESDLRGGHADRAFKLPNPYYFLGPVIGANGLGVARRRAAGAAAVSGRAPGRRA